MTVPGQPGRPGASERLVVLFDRDCGICAAVVARLRRWDRDGRLELLPLQAAAADSRDAVRAVAASHPLHDELHVIEPCSGLVRAGGRAVLEIAARLPGGRVPALLSGLPPAAWAVGVGYGLVARNRRAISRALHFDTVCAIPER